MNSKVGAFIRNFSYTVTSNLVSLLISTLVTLIIPKFIGIEEYGYWQLYLFYISYIGFLQFGWNEGIYLRYGGIKYNDLNKKLFFSQFWMLTLSQIIIAIVISLVSVFFLHKVDKQFILMMVILCMVIMALRNMLGYILQASNRIKEYAQITMIGRIVYFSLLIIILVLDIREYKLMIIADLIGRLISLFYGMYCCRDMVFCSISTFYLSFKETFYNIEVGIKLMFSNIASTMIIGTVRFGVEHSWDVKTFGKVSLTLSISNFMMIFINAIGVIMFPFLRRIDEKKLPNIYKTISDFLMVILFGILLAYYPLKFALSAWLPNYKDSLIYMALVFPICVYEGKMALLINTYLKTLRKEKLMLKVNLVSLIFSVVLTYITAILLKKLDITLATIVIILAFRCVLAETFLSNILRITLRKDIILELAMTFIFMLTGWFINSWFAVLMYAVAYVVYLIIKRKDITKTVENIKLIINVR